MKLDNLDLQPKYWIQLREQLENIKDKEILLDMLYEAVVDLTCNFSSGNLLYDIFTFPRPVIAALSGHTIAMGLFVKLVILILLREYFQKNYILRQLSYLKH